MLVERRVHVYDEVTTGCKRDTRLTIRNLVLQKKPRCAPGLGRGLEHLEPAVGGRLPVWIRILVELKEGLCSRGKGTQERDGGGGGGGGSCGINVCTQEVER